MFFVGGVTCTRAAGQGVGANAVAVTCITILEFNHIVLWNYVILCYLRLVILFYGIYCFNLLVSLLNCMNHFVCCINSTL